MADDASDGDEEEITRVAPACRQPQKELRSTRTAWMLRIRSIGAKIDGLSTERDGVGVGVSEWRFSAKERGTARRLL